MLMAKVVIYTHFHTEPTIVPWALEGNPGSEVRVHFYRNVWTAVSSGTIKAVAAMLKAIHAQEDATDNAVPN